MTAVLSIDDRRTLHYEPLMPRFNRSEEDQVRLRELGPDFLEVLARGLKVVNAFSQSRPALTMSQVADAVALPRATVRRVLFTLEKLGYLEQQDRYFRMTPRVLSLAAAYLNSSDTVRQIKPIVSRLCDALGESCSAALLDGSDIVFIAHATPVRIMSVGLHVGARLPAFCTSLGRSLLAELPDSDLEVFLETLRPEKLTPFTIVSKSRLKRIIRADRERGYSIVDQEAEIDFRTISVPVHRRDGSIACALGSGMQKSRVSLRQLTSEFLPLLRHEAKQVSATLL